MPLAREACPLCGGQPEATKGRTYWTARCPARHFPFNIVATPMETKRAALDAWDLQIRADAARPSPPREKHP